MQQEKLPDLLTIVIILWAIIFLPVPKATLVNSANPAHKNNTAINKAENLYIDNLYPETGIIPCAMLKF